MPTCLRVCSSVCLCVSRRHRGQPAVWLRVLLLTATVMGLGSVAFHASLRYSMQLLDELPLYALALLAAAVLRARNTRTHGAQLVASLVAVAVAAALLCAPRASQVHGAARVFMAVSFGLAFVYVLTAGSVSAKEVDARRGGSDARMLFALSFFSFVGAIAAWIVDMVACETLRDLPAGLPYPQLHALGWHLGTGAGLYFLFCMLLLHQHEVSSCRFRRWPLRRKLHNVSAIR
uniref:Uncharacterized protein n=2 Tax=Chrysotila carterae TaxID=13221 RepID=A0A7S4BAD2_CHRCT